MNLVVLAGKGLLLSSVHVLLSPVSNADLWALHPFGTANMIDGEINGCRLSQLGMFSWGFAQVLVVLG